MRPTFPEDSFEERRLPRLIVPSLLFAAAAVLYFFYRKHKFVNGIDTPVVITGGSLRLFSDTPFTDKGYDLSDKKHISHKKSKNRIVRITVIDYSRLPPLTKEEYNRLAEGHYYDFPGVIRLYDEEVKIRCDVEASYTRDGEDDSVEVSTDQNGKGLKIKLKRKGIDEYDIVDDQTRQHRDVGKLTHIIIKNDGIVDDVRCPTGKCGIRFTYKD